MKDNNSKQVLLSVLGVAILVVAVVGVSFAAFTYSKTGTNDNTITTGTITMSYNETTNGITLSNVLPMNDSNGIKLSDENQYFDFTVGASITGTTSINYKVTAVNTEHGTNLTNNYVKVYLTGGSSADTGVGQAATPKLVSSLTTIGASDPTGAKQGEFLLDQGTFTQTNSKSYRLRMWVDQSYPVHSQAGSETYTLKVNVYGTAAAQ